MRHSGCGPWEISSDGSARFCGPPPRSRTRRSPSSPSAPTTSTTSITASSPSKRAPSSAERHEVEVDGGGYLVHKGSGRRIDVIYERIEEGRIYDDLPKLVESHLQGRVQAIFAPNVNIVDDKGVYPFIPRMIRTYLGEEPIVENIETWSLAVEEDRRYVIEHFDELVTKSRSGWGGKDVLIAPEESKGTVDEFRQMVEENPRRVRCPAHHRLLDPHTLLYRRRRASLRDSYADYRVHTLSPDPETVEVVAGAMTRVAAPGSRLVNVSSGGVMKDTWVLG